MIQIPIEIDDNLMLIIVRTGEQTRGLKWQVSLV